MATFETGKRDPALARYLLWMETHSPQGRIDHLLLRHDKDDAELACRRMTLSDEVCAMKESM